MIAFYFCHSPLKTQRFVHIGFVESTAKRGSNKKNAGTIKIKIDWVKILTSDQYKKAIFWWKKMVKMGK